MSSGLTLCIVNHDGERYLPDTLAAVTRGVQPFEEIVLVDNASTDGSLDIVRHGFPRVRIVRLATNRGPGAARNAGARKAAYHRILFIDNDVVLLPGCAELLSAALDARKEATFAMPAVVHAPEGSTVQYDGAGAHFMGLMIIENAGLPVTLLPADPRAIDSLITACFLMDRRRWGDEPLFDETFFLYLEDHHLGLRTRLRGQDIVAVRNLSTIVLLRSSFQRVRRLGDGDVLAGGPLPSNPALSSGRLERAGRVLLDRIAALNWSLAHRFLRRSSVASRR